MTWIGTEDVPFSDKGMTKEKMDLLKELAEDNSYWASALHFIQSIRNRKYASLTSKQQDWLFEICATLEVELNRRTAEDLFGDSLLDEQSMKELLNGLRQPSEDKHESKG
jgi:hypothetical protein